MNKISGVNNVSFNGLALRRISPRRRMCQIDTADMLSQSVSDVVKLTRNVSSKRMAFWEALAVNYNKHNYYRNPFEREDSRLVNNVFSLIKKPEDIHRYIIHNFADSFQNIERIFKSANNKRERLEFVRRVNKDVYSEQRPEGSDLIPKLLESPYSKDYIRNYDDIKSYLILHKDDPDAVKVLDSMYEKGTYRNVYDTKLREQEIKKSWNFAETEKLNANKYFENYSESVSKIVSEMNGHLFLSKEVLQAGGDSYVLDIIKTTNKNNVELRLKLLNRFSGRAFVQQSSQDKLACLHDLVKLFETVDKDKQARAFVSSLSEGSVSDLTFSELNEILDRVPTSQLEIFSKNAERIIFLTKGEKRIEALNNEITNPFFETRESRDYKREAIKYGYLKKDSVFKHVMRRLENYFNILRYSLRSKTQTGIEKVETVKPLELVKPIESIKTEELAKSAETVKPVETVALDIVSEPEVKKVDKKAITRENVLSFVTKKLTPKTFDRQKEAFSAGATKMRLGMLPEIFASVADTRKADRFIGKQKINTSNKDVLDLYLRINGNNKKFVNYLLKKRNVDNTRMFEVKKIIEMIDKAEAKIKAQKASNPEYRARDARRYYNHLYEAKIQQFGKLPRTRNK